jgi:cytochrome c biogenesis protein CcmG/thiol:disulfide interchange protein DsbE
MKDLFKNLALFAIFSIVFSGLTGCGSQSANTAANNAAKNAAPANGATNGASTTVYPPLASALADAELEALDGTKTKVSDRKGKVVLLNIWGIWCGPCIAEMPHLVELQEKYRDQGLEIIGLNIGADEMGTPEDLDAIKKFGEKKNINYTLVRSPDDVTKQFYLITKQNVVPQSILINREGQLRGVFVGFGGRVLNSLKETIDKTMNE